VAAPEEHISARLLNRSSRAVTLTDDGRLFYDHASRALEAVSEAEPAFFTESGALGRRIWSR
jgi:DNA-binding transcriptional LysR family regulator